MTTMGRRIRCTGGGRRDFFPGATTMAEQMTRTDVRPASKAALACRLRHRVGRWGPSPSAGEVELENVSAEVIEIEVRMHPLQYLDLVVRDSAGEVIPTSPY